MEYTIQILASDFVNNSYMNCEEGLQGCPITRALTRAEIYEKVHDLYTTAHLTKLDGEDVGDIVCKMFRDNNPKDFTFKLIT